MFEVVVFYYNLLRELIMIDKIKELISRCTESANNAKSSSDINDLRVKYLGKNGEYTGLLRGLKDVPPAERSSFGKLINDGKMKIEAVLSEIEANFKAKEEERKLKSERIDVTLSKGASCGSTHPITKVKNEILNTFIGLGFAVKEGPEIETDYYNFQTLGIPADHPARDMQDTFYVSENVLLRTHTSPMQSRTMLSQKPPIRIVVPGKVYRADDDATHSPIFNQIEGLCVEEGISLAHLKNMLEIFAKSTFTPDTKVRFRPSYFPFTEPSVEVDISCTMCGGKGCRLCKGTGWIEILGAGIVNPVVLENCGIDSKKYSGFAFGFGIDRIAMLKYGIPDIRLMYENDVNFLKQYK